MSGDSETVVVEPDARFPSGPWRGFFVQPLLPGRHWMDLQLTFREGTIRGEGLDWVGRFVVVGRYDLGDGKCWWTKRYVGKHDVAYQGYNEGRGIWGLWEIPPDFRGGFHIWPKAMGDAGGDRLFEELDEPVRVVSAEPARV